MSDGFRICLETGRIALVCAALRWIALLCLNAPWRTRTSDPVIKRLKRNRINLIQSREMD